MRSSLEYNSIEALSARLSMQSSTKIIGDQSCQLHLNYMTQARLCNSEKMLEDSAELLKSAYFVSGQIQQQSQDLSRLPRPLWSSPLPQKFSGHKVAMPCQTEVYSANAGYKLPLA